MNNMKKENIFENIWIRYKVQILLFIGVFGAKVILNLFLKSLTLSTGNDDIGTIAGAAYFAGLDWSNVISQTLYYGWGYSMFMAPAFLLTDNVRILFQIMLAYNALLLALSVVLSYNIMNGLFKIENKRFCVLVSLAANFYFFNLMNTNIIFNENAIIFLTWLILYLLLKMEKNIYENHSNTLLSIFLVLLMGYGLTIHTRFIFVWGAVVVMILVFAIIKKRILVNPVIFIAGAVAIYLIANYLNKAVQNGLWLAYKSDKPLVNSADSLGGKLENIKELTNIDGIVAFLHMLLGQSTIMFFYTGGLMLLFIIIAVVVVKRMLKSIFIKNKIHMITDENEQLDVQIGSGIIFIAVLIIATIFIVNIGCLKTAKTAMLKGWSSKWYIYSRYWSAYCSMAIMLTFVFIYKNKDKMLKKLITIISAIGMLATGILFGIFVATKLAGGKISSALVFQAMIPLTFNKINDRFSMPHFIYALIFGGVWFIILLLLFHKKKYNLAAGITVVVFAYIFTYKMVEVDIGISEKAYFQYIDAKWALEAHDISYKDYTQIYIDNELDDFYNAQFELSRYELIVSEYEDYCVPEQADVQLAISEKIDVEMCGSWYVLYYKTHKGNNGEIQTDYYLLVRNGELAEKLLAQGVSLTDVQDVLGIEKLIYKNSEADIKDIGIDKIRSTDILEQDFDVTSEMLQYEQFAINLMFNNPSGNPSKGKVNIVISQGEVRQSYFIPMDTITTKESVYIYVDSQKFKEGKATILMTCPDMTQYKYVRPYTVSEADFSGYKLRLNEKEYDGQLYTKIVIPRLDKDVNIAATVLRSTDKNASEAKIGNLGNGMKIKQKINLTEDMLKYKYLGIDFYVKNSGDSTSKGVVTIKIEQGNQSDTFQIKQSEITSKDYMRIAIESKKYMVGEAEISIMGKGVDDNKYIKPYVFNANETELPDWIGSQVSKKGTIYDAYLCMNVYGIINKFTESKY